MTSFFFSVGNHFKDEILVLTDEFTHGLSLKHSKTPHRHINIKRLFS